MDRRIVVEPGGQRYFYDHDEPPRTARREEQRHVSSSYDPERGLDEEDDDESKPLTPRDSVSSAELLQMRSSSYLAYFRSPTNSAVTPGGATTAAARSNHHHHDAPTSTIKRLKTPQSWSTGTVKSRPYHSPYTHPMQGINLDEDDDESLDSPTANRGGYVPSHYSASKRTPMNIPRTRISLGAESRRSLSSSSDGGDTRSVASHLFGESFVSLSSPSLSPRDRAANQGTQMSRNESYRGTDQRAKRLQLKIVGSYHNLMHNMQSWSEVVRQQWSNRHQTALPMSPRSRDLADIDFLQEQHRQKMKDLIVKENQGFDFCLILQPQEAYNYWAELLDFRTELLGEELTQAMEEHWERNLHERQKSSFFDRLEDKENDEKEGQVSKGAESQSDISDANNSEVRDGTTELKTPRPTLSKGLTRRLTGLWKSTPDHAPSPSLYSMSDTKTLVSMAPSVTRPKSMFERALGPLPGEDSVEEDGFPTDSTVQATPASTVYGGASNNTLVRRKWGSQTVQQQQQQPSSSRIGLMSPPVRVLEPVQQQPKPSANRLPPGSQKTVRIEEPPNHTEKNPHEITMEEIPNKKIPRGIASRTKALSDFLPALRRGIVLRKHRPGQEATFCKIVSTDGGDTIQLHALSPSEAFPLLREQRRLYNAPSKANAGSASDWSLEPESDYICGSPNNRHRNVRHFARVVRRGVFRIADVCAVHPARNLDPRSFGGETGTLTLRRSYSNYCSSLSFSLVLKSSFARSGVGTSIEEFEIRWGTGEGNESQFRYFDFEAATEGEYWLIFRGFLNLQRDAAVGRFAEQRAAGIGCHYSRVLGELRQQVAQEAHVHDDEFHEPVTVGFLERRIVEWRGIDTSYMKGYTAPGAVPPPSDYFLGFKAPGTKIWSRLRNAGLDIQRVYSLDRRQVILKINCPSYRIMDVAEVLRVKLKTWDGSFASFRQDLIDLYQPLDDPLEGGDSNILPCEYKFASSVRQQIIDFIIRSRIRDSGAEIGQATVKRPSGMDTLGKMVQARVPLHMHGKLDAIFRSWVLFWKLENWNDYRDGRSMSHFGESIDKNKQLMESSAGMACSTTDSSETGSLDAAAADASSPRPSSAQSQFSLYEPPPFWKRFFVGAFFQPLDSIEEYFGEKVAFYFAWLQHTATHLVFLSIAGLFLFICQIASNNVDHPLRPVFAIIVMLWTYVVLVNWRKRANFLAYRWGTLNFKEQEATRPQFRGEFVEDEITGEDIVKYPKWKRWLKYAVSFPVTLFFTGGTLMMILWVHANRDLQLKRYLEQKNSTDTEFFELEFDIGEDIRAIGDGIQAANIELTRELMLDPTFWFITMGMPAMLGLCLPLLNLMLSKLSIMLNNFENYRTESEYRAHLIIKVFSFRFVCYFAHLYYYAFVSTGDENAVYNGIFRVGSGVLVYTTVAHWWQVFLHVYAPILIRKIRIHYREKKLCSELREVELEEEALTQLDTTVMTEDVKKRHIRVFNKRLLLEQAQDDIWLELMFPEHDSFVEYIQAIVQFTFITCFSVVLPITPLICLINYLLSMRLDAYKLCKGRRRPLAEKTGGIGVWEHLLQIVAVISILTNCWLMVYTNSWFIWLGDQISQVGLFVFSEHVMLLLGYVMLASISKMPKSVRDAMKREKHQLDEQRNASMRTRQNHRSKYHRVEMDEDILRQRPISPMVMACLSTETPHNRELEHTGSDRTLWSA
eukprot:scaffold1878_cov170-Amphora_coffeaeformis.AAC.6